MRKITTITLLACLLATTACADLEGIGLKQGIGTLGAAAAGGQGQRMKAFGSLHRSLRAI